MGKLILGVGIGMMLVVLLIDRLAHPDACALYASLSIGDSQSSGVAGSHAALASRDGPTNSPFCVVTVTCFGRRAFAACFRFCHCSRLAPFFLSRCLPVAFI